MAAPKLLPPRDFPVINPQTGRLTDVWYEYFQSGVPASKVFGATTGSDAAAGYLGELLNAGPANHNFTTGVAANVTSKLLTPGNWDISAVAHFAGAGATTVTEVIASINDVSATLSDNPNQHGHWRGTAITDLHVTLHVGPFPLSIATSTTYYLVAKAAFAVSTYAVEAQLSARRVG
jgi:hypothetical protein